ncbi:MAG: LPS export ABC transporter periplasmic protein LptC [Oligoflexia bacterium]|nr:LPS export ABC transporter periplasmic protein LptC [Oligoflexia bacterium]
MIEKRHTFTFYGFIFLNVLVILISFSFDLDGNPFKKAQKAKSVGETLEESFFKKVNFYTYQDGREFLHLDSDDLTINQTTGKTYFFNPEGEGYTKSGREINYRGQRGVYSQNEGLLKLEGDVALDLAETKATSDHLTYYVNKEKADLKGTVKSQSFVESTGDRIKINSDAATFYPMKKTSTYQGNVNGQIVRKRVYEENIKFKSNIFSLDIPTNYAELLGNVFIEKQQLKASSLRGEIYLENYNKKLKYFVLYDDVKVSEKVMLEGNFIERKAFSEKLEGLMSENKVILTGFPKVFQLDDVIKGNKIVLRENTEVVEVDDANSNFKLK